MIHDRGFVNGNGKEFRAGLTEMEGDQANSLKRP